MQLEPLSLQHVDGLAELTADPVSLRYTLIPEPPPDGFEAEWVERYRRGRDEGPSYGWAIVDDGRCMGVALVPHISEETREAEIGYILAPHARGRGLATEAVNRLTRWAFEERGMQRVELRISVGNDASARVAERCGYVYEGTLRSTYFKQGRRSDCRIYSRLPSDPEPGSAAA